MCSVLAHGGHQLRPSSAEPPRSSAASAPLFSIVSCRTPAAITWSGAPASYSSQADLDRVLDERGAVRLAQLTRVPLLGVRERRPRPRQARYQIGKAAASPHEGAAVYADPEFPREIFTATRVSGCERRHRARPRPWLRPRAPAPACGSGSGSGSTGGGICTPAAAYAAGASSVSAISSACARLSSWAAVGREQLGHLGVGFLDAVAGPLGRSATGSAARSRSRRAGTGWSRRWGAASAARASRSSPSARPSGGRSGSAAGCRTRRRW